MRFFIFPRNTQTEQSVTLKQPNKTQKKKFEHGTEIKIRIRKSVSNTHPYSKWKSSIVWVAPFMLARSSHVLYEELKLRRWIIIRFKCRKSWTWNLHILLPFDQEKQSAFLLLPLRTQDSLHFKLAFRVGPMFRVVSHLWLVWKRNKKSEKFKENNIRISPIAQSSRETLNDTHTPFVIALVFARISNTRQCNLRFERYNPRSGKFHSNRRERDVVVDVIHFHLTFTLDRWLLLPGHILLPSRSSLHQRQSGRRLTRNPLEHHRSVRGRQGNGSVADSEVTRNRTYKNTIRKKWYKIVKQRAFGQSVPLIAKRTATRVAVAGRCSRPAYRKIYSFFQSSDFLRILLM